MQQINHKRGDTFEAQCTYTDANGAPVSLDTVGLIAKSQIRTSSGDLVEELVFTKFDQSARPGEFSLRSMDTNDWPIAILQWDIQYTGIDGTVSSTETLSIAVEIDVTR